MIVIPNWAYVVFLIVAIASTVFVATKCGWKTLWLGNGAAYAAMSGMCDD